MLDSLLSVTWRDALYRGDVDHEPRPPREGRADGRTNAPFAATGFADPDGEPLSRYVPGTEVRAGPARRAELSAERPKPAR